MAGYQELKATVAIEGRQKKQPRPQKRLRGKRKVSKGRKNPRRRAAGKKQGGYKELKDEFVVGSDEEEEEDVELPSDDEDGEDFNFDSGSQSDDSDEDDMSSINSRSDEDDDYHDNGDDQEEQEDIAAKNLVKECAARADKIRRSIAAMMKERSMSRENCRGGNSNNGMNASSSSSSSSSTLPAQRRGSAKSILVNVQEGHALFDYKFKLKDYQLTGLNWLIQLRENNINGILADEMGLGKTVQALALIQYLYKVKQIRGPHLVIIPASTKDNWAREIQRWTPALRGKIYYGNQHERAEFRRQQVKSEIDIMLCTYSVFERESNVDDRSYLKRFRFEYVICDEAHGLKNIDSARYKNINSLNAAYRLLLSGTPVQNNMRELLGLISFAMPKMFAYKSGRKRQELFISYFERKYENGKAASASSVIKRGPNNYRSLYFAPLEG